MICISMHLVVVVIVIIHGFLGGLRRLRISEVAA